MDEMDKNKITMKDVNDAFNRSVLAEKQISIYTKRLDIHLDLLFTALNNNDQVNIEFQKDQLKLIRNRLIELEWFSYKERY